jgi:hypothetical protein
MPTAPHSCDLVADPFHTNTVTVEVGVEVDHGLRYVQAPVELGGVKAYRGSVDDRECEINIPASFGLGVRVRAEMTTDPRADPCAVVTAMATAVATKLASNPDAMAVDPTARPLAGWDGCTLYAAAGGQTTDTAVGSIGTSALDSCASTDRKHAKSRLAIEYDQDPLAQHPDAVRQIQGHQVAVDNLSADCQLSWSQGPSGVPERLYNQTVLTLHDDTCDDAAATAEKMLAALAGSPPPASALQRPLVYRVGEPDDAAPGACVDYSNGGSAAGCEPYNGVPAAIARGDLAGAGAANPAVNCAIAQDAVKQVLGPDMEAVLWGEHCFFVEKDKHTREVIVDMSDANAPDDYGRDPSLYQQRHQESFAGVPGVAFGAGPSEYDVYLTTAGPGGDTSQPGYIGIQTQVFAPRGSQPTAPADTSQLLSWTTRIATIIAEQRLH